MATDEQLIHQIKQGENEAFRQLFHKYQKQIYFICLNIVKNPHDTEEVVQDTFVHAYLKIEQLKKPDKFSAWLKRIAQNCSINYVNRKQEESIPLAVATAQISTQTIPDRLLLRRELIDAIMEAIESLPQEDREMIRARIDGLSHSEISEQFGISISASTTRLYRVRKKIKARMKDLLNAIVWLPKIPPFKKIISGGIEAMKIGTSKEVATGIFAATQSLMFSVLFHTALFIGLSFFLPYKFHSDRRKVDAHLEVSLIPTSEQQPTQRLPKGEVKPATSVKASFPPIKKVSPSKAPRGFLSAQKPVSQSEIGEVVSKINQGMKDLQMNTGVSVKGGERILRESGKGEEILSTVDVKRGLEVGKGEVGLTNGVDELAKGRGGVKLEITKVEKFKPVSQQRETFSKQAGLSMLNDIGVADADDTLANVAKDMILDRTGFGVPELPKGEPGGVVIGRGKDIRGYLRFPRLDCSMVDRNLVERYFSLAIPHLMKWVNANTKIKIDMNVEGGGIQLTDTRLFDSPVIFLFGYDHIAVWGTEDRYTGKIRVNGWGPSPGFPSARASSRLTDIERKRLREYLIEKGGILVVDTRPRINTVNKEAYPWSRKMKNELRKILPEYHMRRIPNDHELYNCYYALGGPPPGAVTSLAYPGGWIIFAREPYLEGISINGRLAVIYCQEGYAGMMGKEPRPSVFRLMTNIIVYALTHSKISDKSRYVPEKEIQKSAEEIPKKPPFIPQPTPNSRP